MLCSAFRGGVYLIALVFCFFLFFTLLLAFSRRMNEWMDRTVSLFLNPDHFDRGTYETAGIALRAGLVVYSGK
jgi:hypothetical protein